MAFRLSTPKSNNSVQQPKSRYVQGGTTTQYRNRLGWWERRILSQAEDDVDVTIHSSEDGRADIIAFNVYGKQNLDWIVLQFNSIVDPITELTAGTQIRLPSPRRVLLDIVT